MTNPTLFLDGKVSLWRGDCREVVSEIEDCSIDSVVTDPPYSLVSIQKRFGKPGSAPVKVKIVDGQGGSPYARGARGFMGKQWDNGEVAFDPEFWREVWRVLKPGGHVVSFGGTRTYHRLACAVEDAGFEIRDAIMWHYGSGFPKSHDVSKGIDKAAGAERGVVGAGKGRTGAKAQPNGGSNFSDDSYQWPGEYDITAPATDAARQWQGWGTALKPATEIIVLARKPLSEPTVAANVLRWGTGAINVDGCRVATDDGYAENAVTQGINTAQTSYAPACIRRTFEPAQAGRWPANIVHDGSEEVLAAFPDAARFFYASKADSDDRLGSRHPTVKPVDLMRWLCRLVTPPNGRILDPFAGTGTTAEAAYYEGFRTALIEREEEYHADIERRMKLILAGPDERRRESAKAKNQPIDAGPLFT